MFQSPRVCEGTKPTAAGIISGKNNELTTVVMNHTFEDVKDL